MITLPSKPAAQEPTLMEQLVNSLRARCERLAVEKCELLTALKALYEATPDNTGGALGDACQQARATIAKAEGHDPDCSTTRGGECGETLNFY